MDINRKASAAAVGCLISTIFSQTGSAGQSANTGRWPKLNQIQIQIQNRINMQPGLVDTDDASEAESMLKGLIEAARSTYGANSAELLQATLELGKLYRKQWRYGELRVQLNKAAQIYALMSTSDKQHFAAPLLEQARELLNFNKPGEARLLTMPVVEFLETDKGAQLDNDLLSKLNDMALVSKSRRDFGTSEQTYRVLLAAYQKKLPDSQLALADCQLQLAEVLKETGRTAAAIELASLALSGQEKSGSPIRSISSLALLTNLQLTTGDIANARQNAQKLNSVLSQPLFQERNNMVRTLLDLANQFARVNEIDTVKTLFSRALAFADKNSASQFDHGLREISNSLVATGRTSTAEDLYLELLHWSNQAGSAADSAFISSINLMLIRFYAQTAQYDKLAAQMTAIATLDEREKTRHLAELRSTIEGTNDANLREKYYLLVLTGPIANRADYTNLAQYHLKLAEIYTRSQRSKMAEDQWLQIVKLLRTSLPADCKSLSSEVTVALSAYTRDKRFDEAQQLATNMVNYGFDKNILISAANGFLAIARCQEDLCNNSRAEKLAWQALVISEKYGGKLTNNYCNALTQYAALLRKNGKVSQAEARERQAAELRKELQHAGLNPYGCG